MGLTATFSEPYFTGGASAQEIVPYIYPLALDGIGFLVDDKQEGEWHDESIPVLRQQFDQSSSPSENSLNPEALWRRSVDSWHKGAGQEILDSEESNPFRFRSSKGIDIWDKWQLKLLPDTEKVFTAAEDNTFLLAVNSRLFVVEGTGIHFTDDGGATWDTVDNSPATDILSVTTDGYYIYATIGTDVYRFEALAANPDFGAVWNTLNCTLIKFVKGRLMAANANSIYEIESSAAPAAHYTHGNSNFTWVDFTEGPRAIYAAGKINSVSTIYRIGILEDASGLDAPFVTAQIPEEILSMGTFLGFVFAGTDIGVRFAVTDSSGDLTIGALLETGSPCYTFEGRGQQVWFGWDNYDATSTGLGRFSFEEFSSLENLAPAYASDLMATATGKVLGIVTVDGVRYFTVSGVGLYAELTDKVASGELESGLFNYGYTGKKIALYGDVQHSSTDGTHELYFREVDTVTYTSVGSQDTVALGEVEGFAFEWKIVVNRGVDTEVTPIIRTVTIRSEPIVKSSEFLIIPLLLAFKYRIGNREIPRNPEADLALIKDWRKERTIITCVQGQEQSSVQVADYTYRRRLVKDNQLGFRMDGTCTVKLKVLE